MEKEYKTARLQLDARKLHAIGVATLVLMVVVAVIILFFPRKTAPIDHFYKALQKGSVSELQKCMPQEVWDYAAQAYASDTSHTSSFAAYMKDFVVQINQALTNQNGEKLKLSYRVTDKKEFDNQQIRALAQFLAQNYLLDADGVTEACEFTVDTVCKGTRGRTEETGDRYIVYKYHEEWFLYLNPLAGLMS